MRHDFFPDREPDMLVFSTNFAARLLEEPGHFGVQPHLVTQLDQSVKTFGAMLLRTLNAETRTPVAITQKNDARKAMERLVRAIARGLRGSMHVDAAALQSLGLPVPRPRRRHVRPPKNAPWLKVRDVEAETVKLELRDVERPAGRARPDAATGAMIFYHVGEQPPGPDQKWRFALSTSQTRLALRFNPALPVGTPIWISAWWVSRRGKPSPAARPVRFHLGMGNALGGGGIKVGDWSATGTRPSAKPERLAA